MSFPRWNLTAAEFVSADPDKIKAEIITRYEEVSGRVLATGDPIRLFLLSIADIIIQQRANINIAAQQNLLTYAQGKYLDALGDNLAVDRLSESYAVTTIRFTLSQALAALYTIPAGFEVTNGVVTFATNEELQINPGDLQGEIAATCTTPGTAGNDYMAGQISTIVKPKTFLASAQNITITSGGADAESDEEYAERLRLAPNSFSVAGPKKAYEFHTYSVSSAIIDVSVYSPNPGEVKICPLLEGGTLPTPEVLDQIEAYLSSDEIRPLTDEIEVLSPTAVNYEINVDYWIDNGKMSVAESIKSAIEKAVEKYRLWQQGKIGRDITPDQLIRLVMDAGAARIDFSTISPSSWQKLEANEVAQCTAVKVTYKGYKEE
jgi:phage-related baseplate assembly protein